MREPGCPRSGGLQTPGSPHEAAGRRGGRDWEPPGSAFSAISPDGDRGSRAKREPQTGGVWSGPAAAPRGPARSSEGTMFYPTNLFLHQCNPCLVLDKATDLKNE